jgi:hypothetical protein
MRSLTPFAIALLFAASIICPSIHSASQTKSTPRTEFTTADLRKLRWLEGDWRGTGGDKPFFERYQFKGDSTLVTTSFGQDETRTRVTETTTFELKDGQFANGGDDSRWAATSILDDSITFEPIAKARNSFRFERVTPDSWRAILTWPASDGKPARQQIYLMERYPKN